MRNKSHRGKAKGNSRSSEYIIDLAVFIDTTKVTQIKKTSKEPQIISDKIDDLFEKSSLNFNPTEYHKVRTSVDVSNFRDINVDQWVTYVYLPDEIENGRLLMELE